MAKESQPTFSVVVPVYNSQDSLEQLYTRLNNVFVKLNASWQLVLVNDCSKDNSWNIIQKLAASHTKITAINLLNNFGQPNAIMCGLNHAKGKYIITMDDDLQHPPEEIPKLYNYLTKNNLSVVYGQYQSNQDRKRGFLRDIASLTVHKLISKITGSGYSVTSYRILEKTVVDNICKSSQYYVMVDVLIKDVVSPRYIGNCTVEHHARTIGKSNYSYKKLALYALNMIFTFTTWPLRVATILGLIFSAISFAAALFYVLYYLIAGVNVSGWTSLMLSITFLSGIILFVLGIIGEYLGRIFLNVSNKPQYIIKEIHNQKK